MSDILFRYLLFARRRERSWPRRLFLEDENLLAAGVEQLVETAAARVEVVSQHERIGTVSQTAPASRHRSVRFYAKPEPNPPREPLFETRSQNFPLRDTLQIKTCPQCRGRKTVRCSSCRGDGRTNCFSCGGSGTVMRNEKQGRCSSCGGSGEQRCSRCRGRGRVRCGHCNGEGQVATWQEQVYRWLIEKRHHDEIPPHGDRPVPKAFRRWLEIDQDRVANFEPTVAADHLGYETPQSIEVIQHADGKRQQLEQEARSSADRYLFHRAICSLTPLGYTVLRLGTTARVFWLVGRGEKAIEVAPRGTPDTLKWFGWLGIGSGGTLAWESLAEIYHLTEKGFLESLGLLANVSPELLAGGAVSSWLVTLAGARRTFRRPPPVRTLAVLPTAGRPTAWLTCLAYLGSYTQSLRVLDRNYTQYQARLRGAPAPGRQSRSLTLELTDGQQIRLVETPNFLEFTQKQTNLMAEVVDAVVLLDDTTDDETGHRERVEERIRAAPSAPPVAVVAITADGEQGLDASGPSLPLESICRAFMTDFDSEIDWDSLFQRLWQPVERLLAEAAPDRSTDRRQ